MRSRNARKFSFLAPLVVACGGVTSGPSEGSRGPTDEPKTAAPGTSDHEKSQLAAANVFLDGWRAPAFQRLSAVEPAGGDEKSGDCRWSPKRKPTSGSTAVEDLSGVEFDIRVNGSATDWPFLAGSKDTLDVSVSALPEPFSPLRVSTTIRSFPRLIAEFENEEVPVVHLPRDGSPGVLRWKSGFSGGKILLQAPEFSCFIDSSEAGELEIPGEFLVEANVGEIVLVAYWTEIDESEPDVSVNFVEPFISIERRTVRIEIGNSLEE